MIVLDTCALIFDALQPARLGPAAKRALETADGAGNLWCSDISWWEIAMLISKGRLVSFFSSGVVAHVGGRDLTVRPRP
jgi:PIN domain nuclease of toxin-antitoxin system